jgi:hypothetical protein
MAAAVAIKKAVVEEGVSTPMFNSEDAVAIAKETVGVAFSRSEEGVKPGGGCISSSLVEERLLAEKSEGLGE